MLHLYSLLAYCKTPIEAWGLRKAWGLMAVQWAVIIGVILWTKKAN